MAEKWYAPFTRLSSCALLQETFGLQVDPLEPFEVFRARFGPELAVGGFEEALGDGAQGPGVGPLHEVADFFIENVLTGYILVHPVLDHACGGVVAEEVIDGGGELESTLVSVALHRRDPLRVRHARAEDTAGVLGGNAGVPARGGGGDA